MNTTLHEIKYVVENIKRLERCLAEADQHDPNMETEINGIVYNLNDAKLELNYKAIEFIDTLFARIKELETVLQMIIDRPTKSTHAHVNCYDSWCMGYDESTARAKACARQAFED